MVRRGALGPGRPGLPRTFHPGALQRDPRRTRSPCGWAGSSPTPSCGTCRDRRGTAPRPTRRSRWWKGRPSSCSATTTWRPTMTRSASSSRRPSVPTPEWSPPNSSTGTTRGSCSTSGMSCDKTGAVVDRILEGEVDHGQHDAVRDVFVAPSGCILVRADLFRELKGFDPGIVAMGEDLDLSWRCQVAGSRVVVAPEARVRHREAVASGLQPLDLAGRGARATPGHAADAATAPRAACRVQELHASEPRPRAPAGGPAGPGRAPRGAVGPRRGPGPRRGWRVAMERAGI